MQWRNCRNLFQAPKESGLFQKKPLLSLNTGDPLACITLRPLTYLRAGWWKQVRPVSESGQNQCSPSASRESDCWLKKSIACCLWAPFKPLLWYRHLVYSLSPSWCQLPFIFWFLNGLPGLNGIYIPTVSIPEVLQVCTIWQICIFR